MVKLLVVSLTDKPGRLCHINVLGHTPIEVVHTAMSRVHVAYVIVRGVDCMELGRNLGSAMLEGTC